MSKETITKTIEVKSEVITCDNCSKAVDFGNTSPFMYEFLPKDIDLCDFCFVKIIQQAINDKFVGKDE